MPLGLTQAFASLVDDEQTVELIIATVSAVVASLTGTWTMNLRAELSFDGGTTWRGAATTKMSDGTSVAAGANITANDDYRFDDIGGATHARIRVEADTSGTALVEMTGSEVNP